MSVQAAIVIYQCDNCELIVSIQTDEEWEQFEGTWDSGLMHDLCPKCRNKASAQRLRDDNKRALEIIRNVEVKDGDFLQR